MATMQALRLTRPDPTSPPQISLEMVPKPVPSNGELLIRVHASAIHPSDVLNSRGIFPLTTYPRIPGRDFSGTVVSSPPNSQFPEGTEIYGTSGFTQAFSVDGAQAQFVVVGENAVAVKPKGLSWVQAATVGVPFTTAALVLRRAAAKKGECVLVLGANGAVGSAVVQLARSQGCKVLLATRNDEGDVNTASDPELEEVTGLTGGKGVDVVVDTVGQPALTRAATERLGRGGRLAFIAAPRTGSTELGVEMVGFYRVEKSLVGCNTLLYGVEEMAGVLEELVGKFESGELKASKEGEWKQVRLEDGVEAYEKAGKGGGGKFVIVIE